MCFLFTMTRKLSLEYRMFSYLEIKKTEVASFLLKQKELNRRVSRLNKDLIKVDLRMTELQKSKTDYLNCDLEAVKKLADSMHLLQNKKYELEAQHHQLLQTIMSLNKCIGAMHTDLKTAVKKSSDLHDDVTALASVLQSAVNLIAKYITDDEGPFRTHDRCDESNIYGALQRAVELQESLISKNPPWGFKADAQVVKTVFAKIYGHMPYVAMPDVAFLKDNLVPLIRQQETAKHWSNSTQQTLCQCTEDLKKARADNKEAELEQTKQSLVADEQKISHARFQIMQELEHNDTPVLVLNLFNKMYQPESSDFSPERREQVLSLEYDPLIQDFENKKSLLHGELLSVQDELFALNKTVQQEGILLREQYRKASFLIGALTVGGMSAAIIVSYMLSSVALLAIAGLVTVCAARQAYYFFNESKNYPKDPILQEPEPRMALS